MSPAFIIFIVLIIPLFNALLFTVVMTTWMLCVKRKLMVASTETPNVALLVPHFNEDPVFLLKSLDAIDKQITKYPLIVYLVNDGSTNDIQTHIDEWLQTPKKHTFVSIVNPNNSGRKGKVLDFALPSLAANTDVIVIVDSDTYLLPDSLDKLVAKLWSDEKYAAVCGYVVPANKDASFVSKLQYYELIGIHGAVKSVQDSVGAVTILAGAFVAHRATAVKALGGWGKWLVEDIAWTWKALASGYKTGYAHDAIAFTQCPTTTKGLRNQRRRWARGRVEAFKEVWSVSFWQGVVMLPMFILWIFRLLPPMISLMPILAIYLGQFWVFGLMIFSILTYFGMMYLYFKKWPNPLNHSFMDVVRSPFYNSTLELYLWLPNTLGFFDEVFNKSKNWITR